MRLNPICIVIVSCLTMIFFNKGVLNCQIDPYPSIEIPVMDGGYKVKRFYDNPKGTKSLNYYVKAEYPADDVIRFYNSKFKEMFQATR